MDGAGIHLRLLGAFEAEVDGRLVPAERWRTRSRAAALVALLGLAPDHELPRELAMAALWPEADAASAGRNLRKAAFHARRLAGADDLVVLEGGMVRLRPGAPVLTDAAAFEEAAQGALAEPDPESRRALARAAASLYPAELLVDERGCEWRDVEADRLGRLHRDTLVAGRLWGTLLALEPTNEVAHRGIIRERLEVGDRSGAIRQFDELRQVLREELGVGPSAESVALYEEVLDAEGRDAPTPSERARALLAWGVVHWERADLEEAGRAAEEARALAIDAGLGRELAEATELRSLVAYAQGRWLDVFANDFIGSLRETPDLSPFVYDANLCMSEFAIHEPDGLATLDAFGERLLAVADESRSLHARAAGLLVRGEAGLLSGADAASVRADVTASRELHEAGGLATGACLATERQAQLEASAGRLAAAAELHERALSAARSSQVRTHLLPLVFGGMLADLTADGQRLLELADRDRGDDGPWCEPCSMSFHLGAADVHIRAGALEEARTAIAEASRIAAMWPGGPWHAAVDERRAALLRSEGAPSATVAALLTAARERYERAGRRPDATRCRAALHALT